MQKLFGASLTIALFVASIPAFAAGLPEVKISDANPVPACATPGRLMAYLRSRNAHTDPRYDAVATEYMRYGEELGIRWDIAFFQMILETGALSYTGDVRADQNNFAGLGAAGHGQHGERFADIPSGVKAHLQHLLMYAGEHIDNPVAERTRKVQDWGVLTDWQKSVK
ncbi:MAG: glucosaminidase domain-containing protein, partial [Alphaproteobacteria bacterium]